ncbi:MAG: TetR/AcrR family transcriptional regulator [Thermoleophilia bacterium]
MPKVVDHEVRRAEIAEALWRVVAGEGIEAATIRAVAAEAGWSRGIVEHYFDSKDALVLYACQLALDRTLALVKQRHETFVGREALRAVLLDDLAQGRDIWFDLLSTGARDPAMTPQLVRFDSEISTILAGIIAEMVARGEASADLDPAAEARAIFGFNLSLNMNVRMKPELYTDEAVTAEIDGFLDRLTRAPRVEDAV